MSASRNVNIHADPSNVLELVRGIPNNPNELIPYANRVLPGWIIATSPQFSGDLFQFNEQWAFACAKMNVIPQMVVLVTEAYLDLQDTTHKLVRELCKKLTGKGFVVMDSINFYVCSSCNEVIVSEYRVTANNYEWSGKCQGCLHSNI